MTIGDSIEVLRKNAGVCRFGLTVSELDRFAAGSFTDEDKEDRFSEVELEVVDSLEVEVEVVEIEVVEVEVVEVEVVEVEVEGRLDSKSRKTA